MPQGNFTSFHDSLVMQPKSGEEKQAVSPSPGHDALIKRVKGYIDSSRKEMCKHYSTWDYHDAVFRSRRVVDKEDRNALAKGQPAKLIVPLTYAQIMTWVAFFVQTLTQNKRFFQLEATGTEDNPLKEPLERILERDTRRNKWNAFLVQFSLDIGRFSLGAAEICYTEETRKVRIPQETIETAAFGQQVPKITSEFTDIPVFIGNKVYPVSPYRFFPDVNVPLTDFQRGEFCGSEDMFTIGSLRSLKQGLFNLDYIPKFETKEFEARQKVSRIDSMDLLPQRVQTGDAAWSDPEGFTKTGSVVVTKVVADIIPNDFEINGEKVLGTETFPIRYIIWYANDRTIIRFEEAYYLHGQFPYVAAQFLPDQHRIVNESLADVCDQITTTITWLINAAITNKRSALDGKFIVDPAGVDIKSLESRSPYIFLKKNASQTGIDRYIKQFDQKDFTSTYMADAGSLKELNEQTTGFSGFMQGQPSAGRRSATQDRSVSQGASARAKTHVVCIWDQAFEPMGKQFIANNRQEMDLETFTRVMGNSLPDNTSLPAIPDPMTGIPAFPKYTIDELWTQFHADPVTIATSEDFFVYDGSQPSENAYLAQSLQEVLITLLSSPDVAAVLGFDAAAVRALFDQIQLLRGVTPAMLPKAVPQPLPAQGAPQNVTPITGAPQLGAAQSATSVV